MNLDEILCEYFYDRNGFSPDQRVLEQAKADILKWVLSKLPKKKYIIIRKFDNYFEFTDSDLEVNSEWIRIKVADLLTAKFKEV